MNLGNALATLPCQYMSTPKDKTTSTAPAPAPARCCCCRCCALSGGLAEIKARAKRLLASSKLGDGSDALPPGFRLPLRGGNGDVSVADTSELQSGSIASNDTSSRRSSVCGGNATVPAVRVRVRVTPMQKRGAEEMGSVYKCSLTKLK